MQNGELNCSSLHRMKVAQPRLGPVLQVHYILLFSCVLAMSILIANPEIIFSLQIGRDQEYSESRSYTDSRKKFTFTTLLNKRNQIISSSHNLLADMVCECEHQVNYTVNIYYTVPCILQLHVNNIEKLTEKGLMNIKEQGQIHNTKLW